MSRDRKLTPEEAQLWEQVTRDDQKLPGRREIIPEKEPEEQMRQTKTSILPPSLPFPEAPTGRREAVTPLTHGAAPGVDQSTLRKFRRGRLRIEATLDLHGNTEAEAWQALQSFLGRALEEGKRTVRIITGKGRAGEGKLRQAVPGWLNAPEWRPYVLSFDYARPEQGGSGALVVLLKRKKRYSRE